MTINLLEILIGVFAAGFLVFLRNANISAHKQKVAAIRLYAYLQYWTGIILEKDWFDIFYKGVKWNEDIHKIISEGIDIKEILKLEEEIKLDLKGFQEDIKLNPENYVKQERELILSLKKIPNEVFENILPISKTSCQNIVEGKTFITDEEASQLSPQLAQVCIELKMNLIDLITNISTHTIRIRSESDKFKFSNFSQEFADLIWKGIQISKHIDTLSKGIKPITERSIFKLTINNIKL